MPFVQRDLTGAVKGLYANRQPGYAEEFLPDSNTEVVTYLAPRIEPKKLTLDDVVAVLQASSPALAMALANKLATK